MDGFQMRSTLTAQCAIPDSRMTHTSLGNHRAAQQPLAGDSALRASVDGRSEFAWFLSQQWFQADRRAERLKRDVEQHSANYG